MARVKLSSKNFYDTYALSLIFPTDPKVVWEGESNFFLEAAAIDAVVAAGADPRDLAATLLTRMNVVGRERVKWPVPMNYTPTELTAEWTGWLPPGPSIRIAYVIATTSLPASFTADPSDASKILVVAESDPRVARVLRLLAGVGGPPDWVDLFKVIELVHKEIDPRVVDTWSPRLTVFREAAQRDEVAGDLARHAEYKGQWSRNTMDLTEARDLMEMVAMKWIRESK